MSQLPVWRAEVTVACCFSQYLSKKQPSWLAGRHPGSSFSSALLQMCGIPGGRTASAPLYPVHTTHSQRCTHPFHPCTFLQRFTKGELFPIASRTRLSPYPIPQPTSRMRWVQSSGRASTRTMPESYRTLKVALALAPPDDAVVAMVKQTWDGDDGYDREALG